MGPNFGPKFRRPRALDCIGFLMFQLNRMSRSGKVLWSSGIKRMGSMRRLQLLPLVFSLQSGWGMEKFPQHVTGYVYREYIWLNKFKLVSLHASNTNVTIFLTRAARQSQSTEGRSQSPCHTSKVSKPSAILSDVNNAY